MRNIKILLTLLLLLFSLFTSVPIVFILHAAHIQIIGHAVVWRPRDDVSHIIRTTLTQTRRECVIILLLCACAWLMVRSRADTCECQIRGVKVSAKPCIHCLQPAVLTDLQAYINTRFRCLSRNHSDHVWIIKLFFSFICFSIVTYTYFIFELHAAKTKNINENRMNVYVIYLFEIIILIPYYNNIFYYYGGIPLVIFPRETCGWAWRSATLQQWITPVYNIHIYIYSLHSCLRGKKEKETQRASYSRFLPNDDNNINRICQL